SRLLCAPPGAELVRGQRYHFALLSPRPRKLSAAERPRPAGSIQEVTSMRTHRFIPAAGLVLLAAGAPLAAHHSFAAEFDGSKPVTLKGTVTKMEWTNPHAWLHVDVKGADGK